MVTYNQRWPTTLAPTTCNFTRSRNDIEQASPRTRQESFIRMGRPLWQADLTWLLPQNRLLAQLMYFLEALNGFQGSVQLWDFGRPYPFGVVSPLPSYWQSGATAPSTRVFNIGDEYITISGLSAGVIACVQGQNIQIGHRIYQSKTTVTPAGTSANIYLATPLLEAVAVGDAVRLVEAACEMRLLDQSVTEAAQAGQGLVQVTAKFLETVQDFAPSWILDGGDAPNGTPALDIDFVNDRVFYP